MTTIIPISAGFDQPTLGKMIAADAVVQRYHDLFALFDWSDIDAPALRGPGKPANPHSACLTIRSWFSNSASVRMWTRASPTASM
jgi:hypothetical protein